MEYQAAWEDASTVRTLDVSQVVELEQRIAAAGAGLDVLMRRAGASVADLIMERFPKESTVAVFCGTGNNGGDGWVVARLLVKRGYRVRLITPCEAKDINAQPAHDEAMRCLAEVGTSEDFALAVAPSMIQVADVLSGVQIIVDALLGTGFAHDTLREPLNTYVTMIFAMSAMADAAEEAVAEAGETGEEPEFAAPARPYVVAVDAPSGLNAQTGEVSSPVVRADCTVTMMVSKPGLETEAGRALCGEVYVARIADIEEFLPAE